MSRRGRRLVPAVLSVVLFCGALEIALRLVPSAIPLEMLEQFEPALRSNIASERKLTTKKDTVLVPRDDGGPADRLWIYRPDAEILYDFDEPRIVRTVRVDKMGFCNPDRDAYDSDRFDVIVLGDSFSWCTAVEPADTWAHRLSTATGLRVYNLAHPGRGLYEYLQLLKAFGVAKSPEIVIMNVYEGNDFRDAFLYHETMSDNGASLSEQACPFGSDAACRLFVRTRAGLVGRNSYAYNFLAAAAWELAAMAKKGEIDFQYEVVFADGSSVGMNSRNGDRDEVEFAQRLENGSLDTSLLGPALDEFVRLGREHHFVPIVTYTPSAYTAYGTMATFDDVAIEHTMRVYSDALRTYFAERSSAVGFRYLDLTPFLADGAKDSSAEDLLYFRTNVHLTPTGHEVVARAIAAVVEEESATVRTGGR